MAARCLCPAAEPDTCGAGAEAACTDLRSDARNCGACGVGCDAGYVCTAGACEAAACPGATLCGTGCTSLQTRIR